MTVIKLTRLPHLNDTIVIRQEGGRYFIAAENSIIIDKSGFLGLIEGLLGVGYIEPEDIAELIDKVLSAKQEEENA